MQTAPTCELNAYPTPLCLRSFSGNRTPHHDLYLQKLCCICPGCRTTCDLCNQSTLFNPAPICRCVQACGSTQVVAPEDVEAEDVDSMKRLATKQVTQVCAQGFDYSPCVIHSSCTLWCTQCFRRMRSLRKAGSQAGHLVKSVHASE